MKAFYLGIDIGTSGVKAVLFDSDGFQTDMESMECSLIASVDGKAEMDPDVILNATLAVIKTCLERSEAYRKSLSGIGFSCHMHSLMAVDAHGEPLTRLITWADTRAVREADEIRDRYDVPSLYNLTGCRVQHPMYPLSKLLWLKNNDRDTFRNAYKFITIKEYILSRLYGKFVVDYTLAASQGYYNITKQAWDIGITRDILGIRDSQLSEVVPCTHVLRGLKAEYASALGLDPDIPLVIGSGDGILANIGCGVCDGTSLSSTIGTSGAIRTASDKPLLDPDQQTWCYSFTREMWVAGGAINNGGIVLKWLREEFKQQFFSEAAAHRESVYQLFDRYVSEIPPGSEGLIFLPYLTGERSPDWNANARGLMYGLGYSHGRKHIVRAAMEGIMYRMYAIFEIMTRLGSAATKIRANGGYVKSDVWLQMQADIFNREILVSQTNEASALGAAYLCMVALGHVGDISSLLPGMAAHHAITPNAEAHALYMKSYALSREIYHRVYGTTAG